MKGPGIPLTKVQPAVVPEVMLEKLRPPTQSGMRSLEPPPGLPLSFTFDPLRVRVKGVPVTAVNIPVTSQPPRTEDTTFGPDGEAAMDILEVTADIGDHHVARTKFRGSVARLESPSSHVPSSPGMDTTSSPASS